MMPRTHRERFVTVFVYGCAVIAVAAAAVSIAFAFAPAEALGVLAGLSPSPRDRRPPVSPSLPRRGAPVRAAILLHVNDTLVQTAGVRTDSVLGVGTWTDPATHAVHGLIIAKKCGASTYYARENHLRGGVISPAVAGDTQPVTVFGCVSTPPPALDVLTFAQRMADGTLVIAPPAHLTFTAGAKPSCVYVIRRTAAGALVTGRAVTMTIADTSIAKLSADPSCPDTTVDPARIPLSGFDP